MTDSETQRAESSNNNRHSSSSTDVRHLLLSSFLLHILLPLLPRLQSILNDRSTLQSPSNPTSANPNITPPTSDQLGRLQHMSLILSTQAKCSSLNASGGGSGSFGDNEVRREVEVLLKTILKIRNGGKESYLPVLGGREYVSDQNRAGNDVHDGHKLGHGVERIRPWSGSMPRRKVWREGSGYRSESQQGEYEEDLQANSSSNRNINTTRRDSSMTGMTRPRGISTGESSFDHSDDESGASQADGRSRYPSSMESRPGGESALAVRTGGVASQTYSEMGAIGPSTFQSETTSSTATPVGTLATYARDQTLRPR